ncbi:MAG TPA: inositol monophosphatase family protein, partial [Stellaceae bacterium]|nr:inositol monophosphatase family protein [Stellaceae bacterium]
MSGLDIQAVSAAIKEVAAEKIMPRFDNLAADDIREKAPGDLVTIADIETEQSLIPRLKAVADRVVIGEESTAKDPSLLQRTASRHEDFWILDPVDGTSNFAAGMPLFAVMVAYARAGRIVAAWIYDPVSGRMTTAEAG